VCCVLCVVWSVKCRVRSYITVTPYLVYLQVMAEGIAATSSASDGTATSAEGLDTVNDGEGERTGERRKKREERRNRT
jgi:hypothetical protein